MNALCISQHRLLQVTSVSVKGLASLRPISENRRREIRKETSPTDPGVKPFSAIPGPPSLPIIGTLWDYYRGRYDLQRPYKTYSNFLKTYGPLVKENVFLGQTLIHVFHPQDIKSVYKSERYALPLRHSHAALIKYRESRKDLYGHIGVPASNGKEWKIYRNFFENALRNFSDFGDMGEISEDLIKFIKSNLDHNGEITAFPALHYYSLEGIGALVLGKRIGCFDKEHRAEVTRFIQAVHDSHYAVHQLEHKPFILARKAYKTLEISQDIIASFVSEQIDYIHKLIQQENDEIFSNKRNTHGERNSDLVRASKSFIYQELKKGLPKNMILPMAVDFMQGGVHSTAHSLAFALYNLAQNPHVQETLRKDLVKRYPKSDNLVFVRESNYTAFILAESLRLYPPTIGTGRIIGEDIVLSGYLIPKGTKVIIHHEVASKNPENYEDPLKFIPERVRSGIATNPFIELSKRKCMGNVFARHEMLLALTKIFRKFEVSYHYEEVGVINYLINEPDRPMKLRFKELPA